MYVTPRGDSVIKTSVFHNDLEILNLMDLMPAKPAFIDTVLDTLKITIFEEYPVGFPTIITVSADSTLLDQPMRITKLILTRDRELNHITTFFGTGFYKLKVPVAGTFDVLIQRSKSILLSGIIRFRSGGKWPQIDIAYPEFGTQYNWFKGVRMYSYTPKSTSIQSFSWKTRFIDMPDIDFNEASIMGETRATLRISPSIDVARYFGDITVMRGDTLFFNITFQAIDSTNIN